MIIACPECTSPFQVLDDQIAALVQVECPTCRFRMILDFEAANDASLQEAGMRMAQGFRDEATYREAVGAGSVSYEAAPTPAARPEPEPARPRVVTPAPEPVRPAPEPARPQPAARPVPQPEPARPAPEPARPAPEPARPAVRRPTPTPAPTPAVVQPPAPEPAPTPEAKPAKPPVRARPTLIAHTAPPPVRQPPAPQPIQQQEYVEARVDTHAGPGPQFEPEPEPAAPVEVPRPADRAQLEVPADEFAVDVEEPELEPEVPVTPRKARVESAPLELDDESPGRKPPHSPGIEPGKSKPARDDVPEHDEKQPDGKKKGGFLRTFFVSIFLLIVVAATGLIVWSVIETNDPNPLPMLRDKFGLDLSQYGIPVGGGEAPADTKAGDAKAGDAKAGDAKAAN